MFTDNRLILKETAIGLTKIIVAGYLIGALYKYDVILGCLLLAKLLHVYYQQLIKSKTFNWAVLLGTVTTGLIGLIAESWGVDQGHWEYHDIDSKLPFWLPFAWAYSFYFLYKFEGKVLPLIKNSTPGKRLFFIGLFALIFPSIGEIIPINMGVWSYFWPYQLLGLPALAFFCLLLSHFTVYALLYGIARVFNLKDKVFFP